MTTPLIRRLTLKNFLSYGPEGVSVDLLPLNVLIGPNASGKSNLLEALAILRATTGDLPAAIREGGGIQEYLWKGEHGGSVANLQVLATLPVVMHHIDYELNFEDDDRTITVWEEISERYEESLVDPSPIVSWRKGSPTLYPRREAGGGRPFTPTTWKTEQSVLTQRRDPDRYPELTYLAEKFGEISLYQDWAFGRQTPTRLPEPTDRPNDFLLPDLSNLGLVLHDSLQTSAQRDLIIAYLRKFYVNARYISTKIHGGTLQLFIEEEGGRLTPATRLSDGTLRYLCLLAILLHPNPPPVIGIEEPELGLHPDIMPTIAELLKKASERTQLFVTTHSDALVSALSDTPESILVCEGTPDGTTMKRLDGERLREWLDKYSLGEIWRMGEIGGNRW